MPEITTKTSHPAKDPESISKLKVTRRTVYEAAPTGSIVFSVKRVECSGSPLEAVAIIKDLLELSEGEMHVLVRGVVHRQITFGVPVACVGKAADDIGVLVPITVMMAVSADDVNGAEEAAEFFAGMVAAGGGGFFLCIPDLPYLKGRWNRMRIINLPSAP